MSSLTYARQKDLLTVAATACAVGVSLGWLAAHRHYAAKPAANVPEPAQLHPEPAAQEEEDSDSDVDSDEVPPETELKMIVCVRSDLNMSKGKIAAQVGHAVLGCYRLARKTHDHNEWVKAWLHRAQAKITLKVEDEAQMDAVAAACIAAGLPVRLIEDAGRTEVEPGTHTVLGVGPAPKRIIDAITGPKGSIPLRLLT